MKFTIFNFFFFFLLNLNAQDWTPINSKEIYSYSHYPSEIVTNVIKLEHYQINSNGDTSFFMSSVVKENPSDTIYITGINSAYVDYVANEQFLGNYYKYDTLGVYEFYSIDDTIAKFVIPKNIDINDSWLFSPLYNDSAIVSIVEQRIILGLTDSVKVITYHNGVDTIILSKECGIIRFTNQGDKYSLKGLYKKNIGENAPTYREINNFNVGDIFYAHSYYCAFDGYSSYSLNNYYKYKVLSKLLTDSSISYSIDVLNKKVNDEGDGSPIVISYNRRVSNYSVNKTTPYIFYETYISDSYPLKCYKAIDICVNYSYDNTYLYTKLGKDINGYYFYISPIFEKYGQDLNGYDKYRRSWFYNLNANYLAIEARLGLGLVKCDISSYEYSEGYELLGYVKNGDTTGIVPSDSYMLSISDVNYSDDVLIFPNPVNDVVNIKSVSNNILTVDLYSIRGVLLKTINLTKGDRKVNFNMSEYAKGVYIIVLQLGNNKKVKKKLFKM